MNVNHNLKEVDIDNIDVISQLEHQVEIQETKESGRIFDKINSMKIRFYKTGELNGLSYAKTLLRSIAVLNIEINVKDCFLCSILASVHPCKIEHPNKVSNNRQCFDEINNDGFNSSYGLKCSDMYRFKRLNFLLINIFELNFSQ